MDEAEQCSRRNCLRISHLPENFTEDTYKIVFKGAEAIKTSISFNKTDCSHLKGKPENESLDIIV